MTAVRVIPCLLLSGSGLVKTVKFRAPTYIGDPRNAVKIFNEKEVDELVILDIGATPGGQPPQGELLREIVSEAFMPVAYGGGIRTIDDVRAIIALGVEKIVISTAAVQIPTLVAAAVREVGSQSVVVCVDVKKNLFGRYEVHTHGGRTNTRIDPVRFAKQMESEGAGELIVNSIDRDGTMSGYDLNLVRQVSAAVTVPVVACGGAGHAADLGRAVREGGAAAVAAGSLFVFHGKHRAVLISYPSSDELRRLFASV